MSISRLFLHRLPVVLDNLQFHLQHCGVLCASHSESVSLSPLVYVGCCASVSAFLEEESRNDHSNNFK